MNIPEQFQMAQNMRRDLEKINMESGAILSDDSITPQERVQKLQEKINQTQALFTNPEYVRSVQNNALAEQMYGSMNKVSSDGKMLIDFGAANKNMELTRKFQSGEISRAEFFGGLENFSLDPKASDAKEAKIDTYIKDALDPKKAATNWESYKNDDGFLVFQERFNVPSLEDQVDVVFDLYKNDATWLKVQEARGNRAFLDAEGLIDDDALKAHIRRKIQLIRGSLDAQGGGVTTSVRVQRPIPAPRTGGTTKTGTRKKTGSSTTSTPGTTDPIAESSVEATNAAVSDVEVEANNAQAENVDPLDAVEQSLDRIKQITNVNVPVGQNPVTTDEIVVMLENAKTELQKKNIYNDDISEQLQLLDNEIATVKKNAKVTTENLSKLEGIQPGQSVSFLTGTESYIPPSGIWPVGKMEDDKFEVQKSAQGNVYRIKVNNTVVAQDLSQAEMERFIKASSGKTTSQLGQISASEIVQSETPASAPAPASTKSPAVNTKKKTGIGFLDNN
jgi:hypothetical protein